MPTLEYETQISGYVSGYTVTVAIDSEQVLTDMGLPYDHIELQTSAGVTVQSSSSTSVVVTDTSCIFQDIYSNWVVGYALYCDDSGTPVRQFYSSSPNAITASAAQKSVVAVVQLQDGGKAVIPVSAVAEGDKVIVLPLQDGGKVAVPLKRCYTGDTVVVLSLQDGGKVAIPLNGHEYTGGNMTILTGVYGVDPDTNFRARVTLSKQPGETNIGYAKISLSISDGGLGEEIIELVVDDMPSGGITIETPDLNSGDNETHLWCSVFAWLGAYIIIDNVQISIDGGSSWATAYVPDGDFSLGYFTGDGGTGWVLYEYGFSAQMVSGACESCDL